MIMMTDEMRILIMIDEMMIRIFDEMVISRIDFR